MEDTTSKEAPTINSLPPEIISRIGSYVDRSTLPDACLVCKYWLACILPALWHTIDLTDYVSKSLLDQFPKHYEQIRNLAIQIPSEQDEVTALLGAVIKPDTVAGQSVKRRTLAPRPQPSYSEDYDIDTYNDIQYELASQYPANYGPTVGALKPSLPPLDKTLRDCRRLESFSIHYGREIVDIATPEYDVGDPFGEDLARQTTAAEAVMDNNKRTLRELKLYGLIHEVDGGARRLIKEMPLLDSLTLEEWTSRTGAKICEILQSSTSKLKTLSLEMNELSEPFWQLRQWRLQWDAKHGANKDLNITSTNEPQESAQPSGGDCDLTKIRTLILDRSNLSMQSLLDFACVMPDLRELSLKDTYGIGLDDDDNMLSDQGDDDDDDDDEAMIHDFPHAAVTSVLSPGLFFSEPIPIIQPSSASTANATASTNEEPPQQPGSNVVSGQSSTPATAATTASNNITLDVYNDEAYPEDEEEEEEEEEDDDDGDENWEDEDEDEDEDYDDNFEFDYGDIYDDDGEFDPERAFFALRGVDHIAGMFDSYSTRLYHKMRQLHTYCPYIQSFDFTGCRPEGLDDRFFGFICELWGPLGKPAIFQSSTPAASGASCSTSVKPAFVQSPGLKALVIKNVRAVKVPFFDMILRHCGATLTTLDLSLAAELRYADRFDAYEREVKDGIYFDGLLKILVSCATLESLHAEPYPINARSIAALEPDVEWACKRMKSLRIHIEFDNTPRQPGREAEAELEDRNIQIQVCKRLGALTRLEELHLEGGHPMDISSSPRWNRDKFSRNVTPVGKAVRKHLSLSLANGLGELVKLDKLEVLDVVRLGPHSFRKEAEIEWLGTHWPALKRLDGFYDREELKFKVAQIKEQLGPPAHKMPTLSQPQRELKKRYELQQKRGILLTQEMDLDSDPVVFRLRTLRNQATMVDQGLLDMILLSEGMHTVAVLQKGGAHLCHKPDGTELTEDERPQREFNFYVMYIERGSRRTGWGPASAAGGRENSEFMADVMRPRGGRSPSPLGTWY